MQETMHSMTNKRMVNCRNYYTAQCTCWCLEKSTWGGLKNVCTCALSF